MGSKKRLARYRYKGFNLELKWCDVLESIATDEGIPEGQILRNAARDFLRAKAAERNIKVSAPRSETNNL